MYIGIQTWKMDDIGSSLLSGVSLGASLWIIGSWGEILVKPSAIDTIMIQIHFLGIILTSVFLFLFAVRYATGYSLSRRQVGLLCVIPSVSFIMVLLNPWLHLFWSGIISIQGHGFHFSKLEFGPFLVLHSIYSYALITIAASLFIRLLFNRKKLFTSQAIPIIIAILVPLVVSVSYTLQLFPIDLLDPTPLSLTITQVIFLSSLYYTDFYSVVPGIQRVGWEYVSNVIDVGVCITDTEKTVVEYNDQFDEMCDLAKNGLVGEHISNMSGEFSLNEQEEGRIKYGTNYYNVSREDLVDNRGKDIGFVYTFSNITKEIESQQQIRVLNRFLRHNLRNTLSVVLLATERFSEVNVESADDAEMVDDNIEMVKDAVNKLMSMSDAAKDVENAIQVSDTSGYDLKKIVDNAIKRVDEQEDVDIEFSICMDDVTVDVVQNFEIAIEQILQNSVQHTSVSPLKLSITTEQVTEDTVMLRISDNGSGIPDEARDSFETELDSTHQDPLYHGTGLGFGIANWLAIQSDGDFNINEDGDGAVVEFILNRSKCN